MGMSTVLCCGLVTTTQSIGEGQLEAKHNHFEESYSLGGKTADLLEGIALKFKGNDSLI